MTPIDISIRSIERKYELGGFSRIGSAVPWRDRFALFRRNYRLKAQLVKEGLDSWTGSDPYEIADWVSIFTTIERALWSDIRANGLPLWPQYPVGRFFVDFGNPEHRIAVECDGREFHQNVQKDRDRDAELNSLGWTVYRIDGSRCKGEIPEQNFSADDLEIEERRRFIEQRTPAALMRKLRFAFCVNFERMSA